MGMIKIDKIGKAYKQYKNRWGRLAEWILPGHKPRHTLKWVIQDISFTVNSGEAIGIIGINGAGKSTLLKMITGTTQPTAGSIQLSGRVAAMLELGMGFHPDFTGRQNVYMAGQLLGHTMDDISQCMPAIEEFAEIGEYIDKPARIYSSGMQMRLAFSVATAIRPDILIVDEALSVGDDYFQHKSFERIREFRSQGTTLLIVSHDKQAIQSICDRAILLSEGKIAKEGKPEEVMDFYNALLAQKQNATIRQIPSNNGRLQTTSGTGEVRIESVELLDEKNMPKELLEVGEKICLRVNLYAEQNVEDLVIGYMIKNRLGQPIFGTNTHHLKQVVNKVHKGEKLKFEFRFAANLGEGNYSIAIAAHSDATHIKQNYEWRDLALIFNVINTTNNPFIGSSWLPPELEYQR